MAVLKLTHEMQPLQQLCLKIWSQAAVHLEALHDPVVEASPTNLSNWSCPNRHNLCHQWEYMFHRCNWQLDNSNSIQL
jgi:hypothetical protein